MNKKHKEDAKPLKKNNATKERDKDKGHPRNHRKRRSAEDLEKQRSNESVSSRKTSPRRRSNGSGKPNSSSTKIVVTVGHGHPKMEPDTCDAAALLKSMLATVLPRLDEGLAALAEAAVHSAGDAETCTETAQAVRAVGRQITEALRAGVVDGMRMRERHLAQLAVIDRAAAQASHLASLRTRISTEIEHAGLRRVSGLTDLSPFDLAADPGIASSPEGAPEDYELVVPAYVEIGSGRVVERGWVKVAEVSSLPGGKAHGRSSREHRTMRREGMGEDTAATPDNEANDRPSGRRN